MHDLSWWRNTLGHALREAMRAKDASAVSLWRETLSALDHAGAVPVTQAPPSQPGPIAGSVHGLGAGEVARRELTPDDVEQVLLRELAERRDAAAQLHGLGRMDEAARLRAQAAALEDLLTRGQPT